MALHGNRVQGRYALFPIEQGDAPKDWLIHRMDAPSDPEREPMPEGIVPMLARAGELPRPERGWAYEIKWDGVRALAYCQPGELRLESRNLIEITGKYPELTELTRALGSRSAILDGEIVAFDADGRPSFSALQQRMQISSPRPGPPADEGDARHLRDLRPAVAGRALADGGALQRAPRAAGRP